MHINDSAECSKMELDLFNVQPTQNSIEEGFSTISLPIRILINQQQFVSI
jgi:hypothetical protein